MASMIGALGPGLAAGIGSFLARRLRIRPPRRSPVSKWPSKSACLTLLISVPPRI